MKKLIIYLFILLPIFSNSQTLQGKVFGNEENGKDALPGVNIFWQGTNSGVVSKPDGSFEITKISSQQVLVFSFVGYNQKIIHINDLTPLEVVLEPNLELEEVTVIKKDRGTYLSVINPIQTENIGGAELQKAACCNLAESFETNPSVDVSYSDAVTGAKQIRLLGLEGTYSLLQIENMPNLRGLATTFGLTYIPGPWLESIQVSKGAASVLNGYDAIAGQINAELKKPDATERLFLNVYANAHHRTEFNGNGNIRLNDKWSTGIMAHASNLSNKTDDNGDGFMDEPLSTRLQAGNRWKYMGGNGHMAQAGFSVLYEERLGGQMVFDKNMIPNPSNPYGINIETNRVDGFFKTGYVFPNGKTAVAFLSNVSHHKTNSFYGVSDYNADETRYYANTVLTRDLDENGFHTLNAGASFIYDDFNEALYGQNIKRTEKVPGIFAEYTYKPNVNLTLMTGMRTDFHNMFGTFVTPRLHFRYKMGEHFTLRSSAGKGYRTANVLSENIYLLANARPLQWADDVMQEEAWNYGITLVQNYSLLGRDLQLNAEFYRTDFQSQLVVDRETSNENIILSSLQGKSYANSFQFDIRWQPIERLDMLLAYRVNDIKQTIGGNLLEKPLASKYKGLINLNYTTNLKKWMFDYTVQFNGGGRIPHHPQNGMGEIDFGANTKFSPYTLMNAQITKYFRYWNIYVGSENLTNFKQKNPIAGANDPFGPEFDATSVWGPTIGRKIYVGLRFMLEKE